MGTALDRAGLVAGAEETPACPSCRRCPLPVAILVSLLVSVVAPPRLSAQNPTPGWVDGTVEVDPSSLNISKGETTSYRLRLTEQPTDTGWWVRVHVDGAVRIDGNYDQDGDGETDISWVPSVGWEFDPDNWDEWRTIRISATNEYDGSAPIIFDHDVWDHTANCPVHNVGTVRVSPGDGGNDVLPVLSIEDGRAEEGDGATVSFTVTLAPQSGSEVTVNWATRNGTATQGDDYVGDSGTLTFSARQTSKTIEVAVTNDDVDEELLETFTVQLSNPQNATLSQDAFRATGTIVDEDGFPSLVIADSQASEGSGRVGFTVNLIPQSAQAVSVTYNTRDVTAAAGEDYVGVEDGALTFSAGQTSRTINVIVTNDTLDEDDETFEVELSVPVNAELAASATATGTIEDNDGEPSLSISNVSATEGDPGDPPTTIDFTVRLNRPSGKIVTVEYETSGAPDGGTATEGSDYTSAAGTLTFYPAADPLETEKIISVPISNDELNEVNETFTVTLSNAVNATLGSSGTRSATGTIQNDDPLPALLFTNDTVTASEADGSIDFEVELDNASGRPVTVRYQTSNGTATAGEDYTARSGNLLFEPGRATQKTVSVLLKDDDVFEGGPTDPGETFTLTLSGASNANLNGQQGSATGTITDDDSDASEIRLTVNRETISEGAGSQTVDVTATLVGSVRATTTTVNVTVSASGVSGSVGYSVNDDSFPIQILAGQSSGTASFTLTPTNNDVDETNETVDVSGAADIPVTSAIITLTDNDGPLQGITLSVQPTTISEGAGMRTVTVTARLDGSAQTSDTVVSISVSRTGATGEPDFTTALPDPPSITIPQNSSSGQATFTLTPTDDDVDGPNAVATISGTSTTMLPGEISDATLTVEDNDSPSTRVTLSVDQDVVSEGDGITEIKVTATLNGSTRTETTAVSVQVAASGRANVVGFNAVPASFSVQIPAESTEGTNTFNLTPLEDETRESSETVTLRGSTAVPGLNVVDATLVLNDDDGGAPGQGPTGGGRPSRPSTPRPPVTREEDGVTFIPFGGGLDDYVEPGIAKQMGYLRRVNVRLAIWTHKPGYFNGQQILLYRTSDQLEEEAAVTFFVYMENIETGERQYLSGIGTSPVFREAVTDFYGNRGPDFQVGPLESAQRQLIWHGTASEPGRWQFVAEARNSDTTQLLRRAYAKFVISERPPVKVNPSGAQTSITESTTWSTDTLYRIQNSVTVESGATLTIEAGTLIRASGTDASIIVEKGGRIVANGRRESPVVMTCDEHVGYRAPGCWGGLIIRGIAPVGTASVSDSDSMADAEPAYGGNDPNDSSGVLRFLRVEFAGAAAEGAAKRPPAVGLYGAGSGTVIEHVQVHEAAGDGIAFRGGTAWCLSCVSSGAGGNALDWAQGWSGSVQHVYIHQDAQGEHAIHASGAGGSSSTQQGISPKVYNATLVGYRPIEMETSTSVGIVVRDSGELFARNVLVTGFSGGALQVVGEGTAAPFISGESSIKNAIAFESGGSDGPVDIEGDAGQNIEFRVVDPMLFIARYEANPYPSPDFGSAALEFGVAAVPPWNGMQSRSAQYIGAFGYKNWLEEWTHFGPEQDYRIP